MSPIAVTSRNPRSLLIFSKPKVGKTELLAQLPDSLLLDTEKGSEFVAAQKLVVNSIADIREVGEAVFAAGNPYKRVGIDTVTSLEELCISYAEEIYASTPMGKNWFQQNAAGEWTGGKANYKTIIGLPDGAGYNYLRQAMEKALNYIKSWAPETILVGHVKDTQLEKNGAVFNSLDLDLTGKLKRIVSSQCDAIGYLYRKGNQNILSFKTTDDIACGARPLHLRDQEIVVSEIDKATGVVTTHWDRIYID